MMRTAVRITPIQQWWDLLLKAYPASEAVSKWNNFSAEQTAPLGILSTRTDLSAFAGLETKAEGRQQLNFAPL
jgi:hypothetical protein